MHAADPPPPQARATPVSRARELGSLHLAEALGHSEQVDQPVAEEHDYRGAPNPHRHLIRRLPRIQCSTNARRPSRLANGRPLPISTGSTVSRGRRAAVVGGIDHRTGVVLALRVEVPSGIHRLGGRRVAHPDLRWMPAL